MERCRSCSSFSAVVKGGSAVFMLSVASRDISKPTRPLWLTAHAQFSVAKKRLLALLMAVPQRRNTEQLLRHIEESQLGHGSTLRGPFGARQGQFRGTNTAIIYIHCCASSCVRRLHCIWKVSPQGVSRDPALCPPLQVSGVHRGLCEKGGPSSLWQHTLCILLHLQTDWPLQRGGEVRAGVSEISLWVLHCTLYRGHLIYTPYLMCIYTSE